jgi:hypothetical protein
LFWLGGEKLSDGQFNQDGLGVKLVSMTSKTLVGMGYRHQ